jgi:NADPH-dependent 2,4-dienoyl-CoA reductase/sulfur reductase-like enzyme
MGRKHGRTATSPIEIGQVAIVGGGVAAHRCAVTLRDLGYEGRITLISGERVAPYDRTALTKSVLASPGTGPRPLSRPAFYEEAEIELRLDSFARQVQPEPRRILCQDGSQIPYDALVVATGASAIVPPSLCAPGVITIRTVDDARSLVAAATGVGTIMIVGGGLIGCEVASSLCAPDRAITVIEASSGPLGDLLGADVASRLAEFHRSAGVEMLTETTVRSVDLTAGGGYEVALAGGDRRSADLVVVAVGARPEVSWLEGSGVELDDGIVTDPFCRTTVAGVFAAGDCAVFPSERLQRRVRMEHWDAAGLHGAAAAQNLLGKLEIFDPVPFFWSDQHGNKLSMAGLPHRGDQVEVEESTDGLLARFRGPSGRSAVFGLGRTREVVRFRREMEGR